MFLEFKGLLRLVVLYCFCIDFFCNCLCGNYVKTDAFANGHMRLLSSGTCPSSVGLQLHMGSSDFEVSMHQAIIRMTLLRASMIWNVRPKHQIYMYIYVSGWWLNQPI